MSVVLPVPVNGIRGCVCALATVTPTPSPLALPKSDFFSVNIVVWVFGIKNYCYNWWLPVTFPILAVYWLMLVVLPVPVNGMRGRIRLLAIPPVSYCNALPQSFRPTEKLFFQCFLTCVLLSVSGVYTTLHVKCQSITCGCRHGSYMVASVPVTGNGDSMPPMPVTGTLDCHITRPHHITITSSDMMCSGHVT